MSGGYFNYFQYKLDEPIEQMEEFIKEEIVDKDHDYNKETVLMFLDTLKLLQLSKICLHRVDWFLSGDDGEDTFRKRLNEDLNQLNQDNYEKGGYSDLL